MDHAFGARLRAERERRKISLDSIAASSKVSVSLFKALERGDISRWPAGIYRRAFVRAYAKAIGLDPEETLRDFLEAFPDAEAKPDAEAAAAAVPQKTGISTTATVGTARDADGRGIVLYVRLPHTRLTDAFVRWLSPVFAWLGDPDSQSSSS